MEKELVKMTVAIPRALWRAAKIAALDEQRDLREIVIDSLERYLAEKRSKKGGGHGTR
jgi:hypothetical protein